jgi:Mg-chelatase subunit ChlD
MRHFSFQRHLVCLVIGSQLLGCTSSVMGAAPDGWPTPTPQLQPVQPVFPAVVAQPNFQAPSAQHCARPIRSTELPGRVANRPAEGDDAWAAPAIAKSLADTTGSLRKERTRTDSSRLESPPPPFVPPPEIMAAAPPPAPAGIASPMLAREAKIAQLTSDRARPMPQPVPPSLQVTAGVVDDNASFADYLAFRQRTQVPHKPRDIDERYLLQVRDSAGHGVPDAEVRIQSTSGSAMWARTDAAGRVWVSPNAFDSSRASTYQVSVRKSGRNGMTQATGFLQRGQKSAIDITLNAGAPQRAQLDLVFLVDATGSMDDEIYKLKATLRTIAQDVARLPAQPDLCFALVSYRDKGDAYLVRSHDFTNDLGAFQGVLNQLQAAGGGDYPEAMNEALHATVHNLSWRGNGTTRMVFLLADAPPHLDYSGPQYDDSMVAALGKGIKVFGVGASGLDKQGEYIQRQIAQYTGGKFVFLTYDQASNPASGPGRETVHDVQNYSVDSLDRLIVRLVREDLAALGTL